MSVTRVVVAYNSAEALRWQGVGPPTVLVDNASSDDTAALGRALGYRVLRLPQNVGFGRGVMAGLALVQTEFALILNPDARIEPAGIAALLDAAARTPDADVFVPALVDQTGRPHFRVESSLEPRARWRAAPAGEACVPMLSGAALLVRVARFPGFDPAIFLYFEDDDLAFRLRAARRAIVYVPQAAAIHLGNRSGDAAHAIKDRSFGWSMAYVMAKHRRGHRGWALAGLCLRFAGYVAVGRTARARRHWGRILGFVRALRGRPAPFLPL